MAAVARKGRPRVVNGHSSLLPTPDPATEPCLLTQFAMDNGQLHQQQLAEQLDALDYSEPFGPDSAALVQRCGGQPIAALRDVLRVQLTSL